MKAAPSFTELAQKLLKSAEALDAARSDPSYRNLSLQSNDLPDALKDAKRDLLEATVEIQGAAWGPTEYLDQHRIWLEWLSALRWLLHFDIFGHLPKDLTPILYTELASKAAVPVVRLQSVARMAMTSGLMTEPTPQTIAHNSLSYSIEAEPAFKSWARFNSVYSAPSAGAFADATERWGDAGALNETATSLAFNNQISFFEFIKSEPGLAQIFAGYMKGLSKRPAERLSYLFDALKSLKVDHRAHIIDVGGNDGQVALALARTFPDSTFTVQDLAQNQDSFDLTMNQIPQPIKSRIDFVAHDFFTPQPPPTTQPTVSGKPTVYFLRKIIHDWPTERARTILSHLAKAMKENRARLVIMDIVLPQPGTISRVDEALLRSIDMMIAQNFNGKERELVEWEDLFAMVEPRLVLKSWNQPKGSSLAIIEVGLAE